MGLLIIGGLIVASLQGYPLEPPDGERIRPSLAEILKGMGPAEKLTVCVHMREQADLATAPYQEKAQKVRFLKEFAGRSQAPLIEWLSQYGDRATNLRPHWIFNGFYLDATREVIESLARRPEVGFISEDFIVYLHHFNPRPTPSLGAVEWNITKIGADSVWDMGYTGEGIVVGNMDTGVDVTHPALAAKWRRSNGWKDAVNNRPEPYDDHGHGTHTMGTICGGDGRGAFPNDIGVAPGVEFICAKAFDQRGMGNASWIHACFEWFASLAETGEEPAVVSNSWGGRRTDLEFWATLLNLRELGIVPVFSIGNTPGAYQARTPGNFPTTIGVGATQFDDQLASFSSWGPAPDVSPWNEPEYWGRADWNLYKPDIAAPGVEIRSSTPGGGYGTVSGTSMSCPHVAGAVALMLSKNPELTYEQVYYTLLESSARPSPYGPYPNNGYGWGRLSAHQAVLNTPEPNTPHLVIKEYKIDDENNRVDPGETVDMRVTLRNLSRIDAPAVAAELFGDDPHLKILTATSRYGDIAGQREATGAPYRFMVDGSTPEGYELKLSLRITSAGDTSIRSLRVPVGRQYYDYADLDTGNFTLTLTARGATGFINSERLGGRGFCYPRPGANWLFFGGMAAGTDASYLVDTYYEEDGYGDEDWRVTTEPLGKLRFRDQPIWACQELEAGYTDLGHPRPKGLRVIQQGLAWSDPNYDDFSIIIYELKNEGADVINGLYVAQFMDFDMDDYCWEDLAGSDPERRLIYMHHASTQNPSVGIRLLDPKSSRNLSVIDHDQYVYPYLGLPDSIQIRFMNGQIGAPASDRPYDWSVVVSAGPFDIAPGERRRFAIAILGGSSVDDLKAASDVAQALYDELIGIEEVRPALPSPSPTLSAYPNPFSSATNISYLLPHQRDISLKVYDVSGRLVKTLVNRTSQERGTITWDGSDDRGVPLSNGVYFLVLRSSDELLSQKLLILR